MKPILQDLSEPALVTAIEGNVFALFSVFRNWHQAEVHDDPGLLWTITDIPFPLFNSILRARLAADEVAPAIAAAVSRGEARNVPMLWWTGPATQPADLGARLEASGFVHEEDSPCLAVDLSLLEEDQPSPQGLAIERVADPEALRAWCDSVSAGFGVPAVVTDGFFGFYSSLGFGSHFGNINYLGRLNGTVVATASLFMGAGVAGIYNVSTLPDARGKGIGSAMTLRPLLDARAMGYRVGTLQSTEMGAGVYRRLGFRQYCELSHYLWPGGGTAQATI